MNKCLNQTSDEMLPTSCPQTRMNSTGLYDSNDNIESINVPDLRIVQSPKRKQRPLTSTQHQRHVKNWYQNLQVGSAAPSVKRLSRCHIWDAPDLPSKDLRKHMPTQELTRR